MPGGLQGLEHPVPATRDRRTARAGLRETPSVAVAVVVVVVVAVAAKRAASWSASIGDAAVSPALRHSR